MEVTMRRTVDEINKSHIENALNVPYMFITQEGRVENPDFIAQVSSICKKDHRFIVGCNSGGRSSCACDDVSNAGFKHVTNMEGGYPSWVDNILTIENQQKNALASSGLKAFLFLHLILYGLMKSITRQTDP
ncbi:Rhodanese-like domain [Dillenia turbinata]|uniref:Rhodanese-like domain n=1 Tax=Dillenia turbinata TaxID=194707 RepID=A0AAN8YVJ2_9MAGN